MNILLEKRCCCTYMADVWNVNRFQKEKNIHSSCCWFSSGGVFCKWSGISFIYFVYLFPCLYILSCVLNFSFSRLHMFHLVQTGLSFCLIQPLINVYYSIVHFWCVYQLNCYWMFAFIFQKGQLVTSVWSNRFESLICFLKIECWCSVNICTVVYPCTHFICFEMGGTNLLMWK